MHKKNYLTKAEQMLWEFIGDKELVDNELVRQVFPDFSENKRNKLLNSLYAKGYLRRAKRDLYYNHKRLGDFYSLALRIKNGYIGFGSALKHYGLLEYEDFTILVATKSFQKKIELKGTEYTIQFVPLRRLFVGFEKRDGVYVSTIEKTFFDCFLRPRLVGFTNLTKALHDAEIDWHGFVGYFKLIKNNALRQRTGYILELVKKNTKKKIPSFVFAFLLRNVRYPVKLLPMRGQSTFNRRWKVQDNVGEKNILSWWL